MYISNSLDEQGLFGYISGAAVKNVGVIGSSISGKIHVGGIVGSSSGSRVENCYNASPVAGDVYVGGVVGGASGDNLVKNCYNTNTVTSTGISDGIGIGIGGVAGIYTGGSIENCYNTGNVSGASPVGGVVGILQGGGALKNCVSLGQTVNGTGSVGRVISGLGNGGTVTDSYARKDMKIGASGSEAIVTDGAANNQNGMDLAVSTAIPQAWGTWFSDTAAWDITGVGNLAGGANLPILKDFSAGQNPTLPGSIQAETYTLTVNLDGGNSGITGGNYIAGAEVAINAGTKAGYTFSGWTTSNGGTFENATLPSTNFTMPAVATTITATWTPIPFIPSVHEFNISDGPIKVEDGATAGALKVTYGTGQIEDNIDSGDMLKIIQTTASTATANTIVVNTSGDETVNITLSDVNIDVSATSNSCAFEIQGNSVVNLTLTGSNTIKSGGNKLNGESKAGLQVETKGVDRATLTIDGTGTLDATGGWNGAGIGGGRYGSAGVITINGGVIIARSEQGAGIGGGFGSSDLGGVITITGGTVTATATNSGAGIGGGDGNINGCTINITGGDITATGGDNGGAGIGSGRESGYGTDQPGTITISGTAKVTAIGGQQGAGIGGGVGTYDFNLNKLVGIGAGPININGGTVIAKGGIFGAGIGGGNAGAGGTTTISGGTVTALGGSSGAGLGGGKDGDGGIITISGGNVTATGSSDGAGIGGGKGGQGGIIKIDQGAMVIASAFQYNDTKNAIDDTDGMIEASAEGKTVANILMANYTDIVSPNKATTVKNGATEVATFAPTSAYKSIAYTVSAGSYTLYKGAIPQTHNDPENKIFEVSAPGLNIFSNVKDDSSIPPEPQTYTVNGTIKDTNNNPVSGATVTLTDTSDSSKKYTGTTDSNGNYSIPSVPDGSYTVSVTKGSEPLGSGSVTVNGSNVSGDSGNITVTPPTPPTTPTYTVSGTIKDTNNNPVSGATVTLTDTSDSSKKYTGTTDSNGNYSIPGVPDGSYTVSVTKGSETLGGGSVTVNGSNVSGDSGNITVTPPTPPTTPTYTVSGTIKDTNNNPVSGATVTLTDTSDSSKKYTGITDSNGNYSIPSVPDGSYTVSVTKGSETLGSGGVTVNGSNVSGDSGNIIVNPPTITTAQTPVFSASNVRGIEAVTQNAGATQLSVTAAVTDSGTISYQWYKNVTNSTTGGTPISGATSSNYTPPTDTVGITYYYAVVTNIATVGGETKISTNTSGIKKVVVLATSAATYDVSASSSSLSNITLNNTSATQYQNYTTTLSPASGYSLPGSITITMGGVTLVPGIDYIYTKTSATTGTLTVYNVTGELSIRAAGVLIPTQTYTITFNSNGGSNVGAMSGTYGTAISLPTPTKPGYNFVGWYKDSSFATSYLATAMGAENITLHAKWEQLTYTVTGNVKDENNANADSATVKLMAGSRQVAQATTDANGVFSISGIPSGIYNLVISKGTDQIITLTITVSGDIATGSVTLPKGNKNSVVEVKSGTPDIIVDKLNDFFTSNQFTQDDSNVIDVGGTVEIRLIVEQRVESGDNAAENAQSIKAAAGSRKEIGIFLNLSLSKIVTPTTGGSAEQPIPITELDNPLIIDIPLPAELQGKNNYVVYRYHGTEVQTITQTNSDAEYIELSADGKSIRLHTKKFSTYAIGYTAASTPSKDDDRNDGGTTTAPTITTDSNTGGKVTISSDQKTATITPEEGYIIFDVLVDGKSVGAIATYTFADSENHKIRALFAEKTGVKRLAGVNRVDTALEIAKAVNAGKVSHVILATAENYPDALAGSILAGKYNAPILLVGTDADDQEKVLDYVQSNLEATGTIYILGGFAVVSQEIEGRIKALGFGNIIRLGGKDRYETSAMIAAHLIKDNEGTPIIITSGEDYPDALSISSIASRQQYPILLTAKNELSSAVKQIIQDSKPSKIYLIGLEGSINSSVEEEIQQTAALDKGSIIRIGGADRFETSLAIARHFKPASNYVSIATGNNFPDALSGSLYAARMNAPILLVNETISDQMMSYIKEEGIKGATIFGGEAVVSKKIFEELTNLVKP